MRQFITVASEAEKLHTVVCNMCGQEVSANQFGYLDEYLSIEKFWGFGSPYDGDCHTIDICMSCYEKFVNTCKIPPHSYSHENTIN
ncbi:MAG: hypothetical protein LBS62_04805 [Clostridiales bacterium]|jgi:ribosomal-protein-alanine N-acetyltransferase|nr:hypothetical protein [Clostridiales bacterium]